MIDVSLYRDSAAIGVSPEDVHKAQLSLAKQLIDKIKKKLKDLWNDGTGVIPIVGALVAVVAAPIYAYFSLT